MTILRSGLCLVALAIAVPSAGVADDWGAIGQWGQRASPIVATVKQATARYQDVQAAVAAGYQPFLGCVSGPDGGAMGVHYINGGLVGDGALDVTQPEALIYEPLPRGAMRLVGVEYITFAEPWHAGNAGPPVLEGQVFNYEEEPNRYAAPAHYDLHIWAWKDNPAGTFADWNPRVTCEWYQPAQ